MCGYVYKYAGTQSVYRVSSRIFKKRSERFVYFLLLILELKKKKKKGKTYVLFDDLKQITQETISTDVFWEAFALSITDFFHMCEPCSRTMYISFDF